QIGNVLLVVRSGHDAAVRDQTLPIEWRRFLAREIAVSEEHGEARAGQPDVDSTVASVLIAIARRVTQRVPESRRRVDMIEIDCRLAVALAVAQPTRLARGPPRQLEARAGAEQRTADKPGLIAE